MTRNWFGTDGIRGPAGIGPLAPDFLRLLGRALGAMEGAGTLVLLARDTRASGTGISADLAHGLHAAGTRVVDLGVVPTAGLPMAMRDRDAALGVVVSASHNPWRDNGVKVFGAGGLKLSDEREHAVERELVRLGADRLEGAPASAPTDVAAAPELVTEDGATGYVQAIRAMFAGIDLSGLRLAVDCAHGSASDTAPAVLSELGADVYAVCAAPDGRNINEGCGSTHLDNVARVVTGSPAGAAPFDLGLAFDGDADRVLMVDGAGRSCTGDHMLGFLGGWMADRGALPGRAVVATVMSNLGLERMLTAQGIRLHRTPVGDRYVLAAMQDQGLGLGGEDSGHLVFAEGGAYIGDGLFTALRVLAGLVDTGRDLASVVDAVPNVPQVLLNVPVTARPPVESLSALTHEVEAAETEHGDAIRIVLRYSGTENLARVMVEGLDAAVVDELSQRLARIWREQIDAVGANSGDQSGG